MAPRANWKGFLRLAPVTCPLALFPATSESEKVSFNRMGYKADTDTYVTVDRDELDDIALESTRTIDIDEFVPKSDIDRYENALVVLLNQKRKGEPIRTAVKPRATGNVINLMDALRKSLSDAGKGGASQPAKDRKPEKAASGQREMLMAISAKGKGKAKPAAKETKRLRKAG